MQSLSDPKVWEGIYSLVVSGVLVLWVTRLIKASTTLPDNEGGAFSHRDNCGGNTLICKRRKHRGVNSKSI